MEVVVVGEKNPLRRLVYRIRAKVITVPGDDLLVYIIDRRYGFVELSGPDAESYIRSLL